MDTQWFILISAPGVGGRMHLSLFSYQCSAPNAKESDMAEHTDTGDVYTSVFNSSWLKTHFYCY